MKTLRLKSFSLLAHLVIIFFAVSCLALTSCSGGSSAQTNPQAEYNAAVQDAKTLTVTKISKHLTAIVPENSDLIWENNVPGTRVLVATWIGSQVACQSYTDPNSPGCKAGQECQNYGYNSWVTVAPELKNLLGNVPTLLRVSQALGLPPPATTQTMENTCIVEL